MRTAAEQMEHAVESVAHAAPAHRHAGVGRAGRSHSWYSLTAVKPPTFAYEAPDTLDEALSLLGEHGDEAKILAGGQSLVPLLNFRLARPSVLVDINSVRGLADVTTVDGAIGVGSMVRERAAGHSTTIAEQAPLLAAAIPLIGHEAIRTRGTVGGSISHGDPAAELPAVAVASRADMVARSAARGERTIQADDFFQGYFTTALEPDELLVGISFPKMGAGWGAHFEEAARREGDFAMVGVAAAVHIGEADIADARLVLIGVGDTPVHAGQAEQLLIGSEPGPASFDAAAEVAVRDLDPPSDLHASSAYRRHVARILVRRALDGCMARMR
jgi:carbon-monoxide dehydrogenase medium subunit